MVTESSESQAMQPDMLVASSPTRTPLYELAVELKARMTAFAGWEMPVQFSGITQEHQAVRQHAGILLSRN